MAKTTDTTAVEHNSVEQLRGQAARVKEDVQELGHIARDVAREKLEELRHKADEYAKSGRAKAQEWEKSAENAIREHPIRSVLIAAGIGVVVGFLLRRR